MTKITIEWADDDMCPQDAFMKTLVDGLDWFMKSDCMNGEYEGIKFSFEPMNKKEIFWINQ